uniref:Endoplasmic reticulum junction formation protein lunapark n=1 Tax=Megaselia scalaris TaxID=36166 RepID=T1GJ40_MEGSC
MGIVLAKFRKEKTTYEILEKLEADIKKIEEYSIATQTRQKRFVGNFLVISIGLYIACFLIFYFAFFPPTWTERLSYSVPLLIFPLIIFFLRRFLAWFFQRKINSNAKKLNEFQAKKKEILEKVMDNETYKVALSLLTRFGDGRTSTLRTATIAPTVNLPTPVQSSTALTPNKNYACSINPRINNSLINTAPASGLRYRNAPLSPPQMAFPNNRSPNNNMASMPGWRVQQQMRPRTPFPIMNQQNKGVLEKMVDYIIGDGPQNRFAMICKQCFGHNGMALEEEYEYMTFRCVYCNFLNPSKKSRPVGPKLPVYQHQSMNDSLLLKRKGSEDSLASTDETNQESEDNQNINESEKEEETIFDQKKEKDETEMESDSKAEDCCTESNFQSKTEEEKKNE